MPNNSNYNVGVFYMPFWQYTDPSNPLSGNWSIIDNYDTFLVNNYQSNLARIPANIYYPSSVWYDETMPSVTEKQLQLMSENEIDFVVFDSFWTRKANGDYSPSYSAPINNLQTPGFNFHGTKFALSWCNDFMDLVKDNNGSAAFFDGNGLDAMIDYWKTFVDRDEYLTIDGKKVFYVYYPSTKAGNYNGISTTDSIEGMCGFCRNDNFFASMGTDADEPGINSKKTKFLLDYIEARMSRDLHYEMYFVAVIAPPFREDYEPVNNDWAYKWNWLIQHPQLAGYSAVTSYGYKYFEREDAFMASGALDWSYNYGKMQAVYQRFYDYMINNSALDYHVPVTAGYDQGPVNLDDISHGKSVPNATSSNDYARDPADQARSTPSTFQQSLVNAKNVVDSHPAKTKSTVIISAWNEYAEGYHIEPSYTWGTQYLDAVKNVFM